MRLARLRIPLELILCLAFVASAGMMVRRSRQLADLQRQRSADLQSLRDLQEALRVHNLEKAPAVAEGRAPGGENRAALAERDATIERLNRELSDAQANVTQLQAQLASSGDEHAKALASASEQYQKDRADWQSRLDALQQQLDSTQAALQASRQRITNLEAANTKLSGDNSDAAARSAESARVMASLQELDRRRDAYLTSIMRRYRDITSQFRAMGGMLDSSRDPNSSALSAASLTRIQNAISLADDDLRQLSELNAQARELEKKLAKK